MTLGDSLSWYAYKSDDTKTYNIKLYDAVGLASDLDDSTPGKNAPWPWHYRDLRHLTGYDAAKKKRSRCPVNVDDDRYVNNEGTFAMYGATYVVTGSEGERRPASHLR